MNIKRYFRGQCLLASEGTGIDRFRLGAKSSLRALRWRARLKLLAQFIELRSHPCRAELWRN